MVLYTVMPLELVFADKPPGEEGAAEMVYLGRRVSTRLVRGERQIVQLYSTDPQDFLDPRFQPGSVVQS